jgi:hypothetical protein
MKEFCFDDEGYKRVMDAFYGDQLERAEKETYHNLIAKKIVQHRINYRWKHIARILSETSWTDAGIVEVERSDYKNGFYPGAEHYTIKGDKDQTKFMKQTEDGVGHVLIWQVTGFLGDNYNGWMLFPLSDGKYWKVDYNC